MSSGRWLLALGACLLLVLVSVAMLIGLSVDDAPRQQRSRRPLPRELREPEQLLEPEPEQEQEQESEQEPEQEQERVEGVRTLVGTVSDDRNEPLEGVEVTVDGSGRLRDVTNAEGAYSVYAVTVGEVTLVARATGFAVRRVAVGVGEPQTEERVDVRLAYSSGVGGMVVDPDGTPVEGARVRCAVDKDAKQGVVTDRYGRFELLQRRSGCDGVAHHPSRGDSPHVVLKAGSGNLIALAPPASISGRVVGVDGEPVRDFVLTINSFSPEGESRQPRRYRQRFTHPKGRFTVRDLQPGSYVFAIARRNQKPQLTRAIVLKRGQQLRDVHVMVR